MASGEAAVTSRKSGLICLILFEIWAESQICIPNFELALLQIFQVWPNNNSKGEPNKLQLKLMQKLGDNARHFILQFPQNSPNSVAIVGEPGDRLQMGVSYEVGTITNFLTTT